MGETRAKITLTDGTQAEFTIEDKKYWLQEPNFAGVITEADLQTISGSIPKDTISVTLEMTHIGRGVPSSKWEARKADWGFAYRRIHNLSGLTLPPSVTNLHLENNGLQDVSTLNVPPTLKTLALRRDQINASTLKLPDSLSELELYDCSLKNVSPLKLPKDLKSLRLDGNELADLSQLNLPRGLQQLGLSSNKLTNVNNLVLPQTLEELYLSSNQLTDISQLKLSDSLRKLDLGYNRLLDINKLKLPPNLEYLNLERNGLSDVSIANLSFPESLTELDLRGNYLSNLKDIKFPNGLTKLNLSSNQITDIRSLGLEDPKKFPNLQILSLSDTLNQESIEYLRNLERDGLQIKLTYDNFTTHKSPPEANRRVRDPKIIDLKQAVDEALGGKEPFITRQTLEQLKQKMTEVESALPQPNANAGKVLQKQ